MAKRSGWCGVLAGVSAALLFLVGGSALAGSSDLDTTFNGTGVVATAIGPSSDAYALVLQPDGKLVAAGDSAAYGFALARYNADGSLDSGFNGTGTVGTPIGSGDLADALVLQPD